MISLSQIKNFSYKQRQFQANNYCRQGKGFTGVAQEASAALGASNTRRISLLHACCAGRASRALPDQAVPVPG